MIRRPEWLLFCESSGAVDALTSLVDSLGGILWTADRHAYTLPTDTAQALTGDPVGYLGSHRQDLPENYIKNSMMVGGAPGVLPTNWTNGGLTVAGVTATIDGIGTDDDGTYLQISLAGTCSANNTIFIFPNGSSSSVNHPSAKAAQLWSGQLKVKGISGTQRNMAIVVREIAGTSFGSFSTSGSVAPINDVLSTYQISRALADVATDKVSMYMQFSMGTGQVYDNVVRIYAPQLERGKPTAFTATSGAVVTRGNNFEPAWQDTTANKPLMGRGAKNLMGLSDDYANAVWTKMNIVVTGELVSRTGAGTNGYLSRGFTTWNSSGITVTAQIKAKAATVGGYLGLRIQSGYPERVDAKFNLLTGEVVGSAANTMTSPSATISGPDAEGYYLCTLTGTIAGTGTAQQAIFGPTSAASSVGGWESATGEVNDCYAKNFQVEYGPTAGPFVATPTTSPAYSGGADARMDFDGTNDFFRTGIQTPKSGYLCGAWVSVSSGAAGAIMASSNVSTIAGVYFNKGVTNNLVIRKMDGTSENLSSAGTGLVAGAVKRILDGHFDADDLSVRVDGVGSSSAGAVDPTSTNYFRLGAAGNGGDTQAIYWRGNMCAQVWIPGERPGATVEAKIRTLMASMCKIAGVV